MQHGRGHRPLDIQHGHGHVARTWTCSTDMENLTRNLNMRDAAWTLTAAWIWTYSMDVDMQLGHKLPALTSTCRTDGHGHAVWMWTCIIDMNMQPGLGIVA